MLRYNLAKKDNINENMKHLISVLNEFIFYCFVFINYHHNHNYNHKHQHIHKR